MPTTTRSRTATRTSRSTPRFSRTGTTAPQRRMGRRSQPQASGAQKVIGGIAGALPGILSSSGKGKASARRGGGRSRGSKAGGAAIVTAVAGLAFSNRDKLSSLLHRGSDAGPESSTVEAGTRPSIGTTDPARTGDIAPSDPGNRPDQAL